MEPDVVVLDEPTEGLYPMGVSKIMKFLKEMRNKLGLSIVIATHGIDIGLFIVIMLTLLMTGRLY